MRWNLRTQLAAFLLFAVVFVVFILSGPKKSSDSICSCPEFGQSDYNLRRIACKIDGSRRFSCIRDEHDVVYVPFEPFLKRQFDVSGKIVRDSRTSEERFDWWTSYARGWRQSNASRYDSTAVFGRFGSYNVENRDRVRCINAEQGIPMSTQWDPNPYFYPIQIAQFALQHYSRNITETPMKLQRLGENSNDWRIAPDYGKLTQISEKYDENTKVKVLEIDSPAKLDNPGVFLSLKSTQNLHVIEFEWMGGGDSSFSVILELLDGKRFVRLDYVRVEDSRCVWADEDSNFVYALGTKQNGKWIRITRDILVDYNRALSSTSKSTVNHLKWSDIRLVSLSFRGQLTLMQKVKQMSNAHMQQFMTAADWFLSNQDETGGWTVPVERKIANKRLVLEAGWHSAMAQGHAMSVLTRAYSITRNEKYLKSAQKATVLFDRNATDGGVRNYIFNVPWYEEYPTTPGSFVLNGFMYSLIGLYDLARLDETSSTADRLYRQGIQSLLKMLPFYDTGSGSVYDLRHFSLQSAPNLARWDYHAVHIDLLLWLASIEEENARLVETAERWIGYAMGRKAKKN